MRKLLTPLVGALALALISMPLAAETTTPQASENRAIATFAAGCFWCVESDFDKVDGVLETTSGYAGGATKNPTYGEVSEGASGHAESVQITYDTTKVTYQKLLDYYWHHVDLVDGGGQFCDRGSQYRPVIFTNTDEQKKLAEESKAAIEKSGRFKQKIAVQIVPATTFTAAEEYHQDYYKKNPIRYRFYRTGCGRDARIEQLWGSESASTH